MFFLQATYGHLFYIIPLIKGFCPDFIKTKSNSHFRNFLDADFLIVQAFYISIYFILWWHLRQGCNPNTVDLVPPAAKNLFEKRFLDFQKLLVIKRFFLNSTTLGCNPLWVA